jgi:glutathione S-transferase
MIRHYFNPMSRAASTDWMFREAGAEHEQVWVDIQAGDTRAAEYLALNPMGKVPMVVDGGVVITEVAAICAYLADKYPEANLAPAPTSALRGRYYRYLFYPAANLEPVFALKQMAITDYPSLSVGWGDLERCLATIEAMTPDREDVWVIPGQFTAADVVFGGTLDLSLQFQWLTAPSDKVMAYVERIRARPAYQASHETMA